MQAWVTDNDEVMAVGRKTIGSSIPHPDSWRI